MKSSEILKNVTEMLGISVAKLNSECGLKRGRLSEVATGRVKAISEEVAKAIVTRYPGISYRYLISGEGSMYADGDHIAEDEVTVLYPLTHAQVMGAILMHYRINAENLAKVSGIAKAAISQIKNGKRAIVPRTAELLTVAFPNLSKAWVLSGTGPMLIDGSTPADAFITEAQLPDHVEAKPTAALERTIEAQNDKIAELEKQMEHLRLMFISQNHEALKDKTEYTQLAAEPKPYDL